MSDIIKNNEYAISESSDQTYRIALRLDEENEFPINGRELHERLGIETEYRHWFPRMCEYGFEEGKDFNSVKIDRVQIEGNRKVTREVTNHTLTLNMAKELCMLQRTDKGREIRRYLISIEQMWNNPEQVMARALKISERLQAELREKCASLEAQTAANEPKVTFANAVEKTETSILVGDLAKLIKQNGVDIGQNRLFRWMRDNGYLIKDGQSKNLPTQASMEKELFKVKESVFISPNGSTRTMLTPTVTGKGQLFFVNQFLQK